MTAALKTDPLAELVGILGQLDCRSYTLHATDSGYWTARATGDGRDGRINIRLTVVGRTAFEQVCAALGAQPKERVVHVGQRSWFAETDTTDRRLLIEGVSFQYHDDWEPRR